MEMTPENLEIVKDYHKQIRALKDALLWCSGSADFGPDGQAREGWLKVCEPLLMLPQVYGPAPVGWSCPKCGRVWGPNFPGPCSCTPLAVTC